MSYAAIAAGLQVRLKTVPGLKAVLDYAPTSIQIAPLVYSILDSADFIQSGQVQAVRYRVMHRLCVRWQDNERAEQEITPLVDAIPAAIKADPYLGGALKSGGAAMVRIETAWVTIAGTEYRAVDFYTDILEK